MNRPPTARLSVNVPHDANDLSETKNLATSQPAKVKELHARLAAFLHDAVNPGPLAADAPGPRNRANSKK